VIMTSERKGRMTSEHVVRGYNGLSNVGRIYRSLKETAISVRPVRYRLERRVRAHIFVCMQALLCRVAREGRIFGYIVS